MQKLWLAAALFISIQTMAQWPWDKLEGNGNRKTESREAGNFTSIASSGSWDVLLSYGETHSIRVEGDENLLNYIETSIEKGKLSIKSRKNTSLRSKNKIKIYVSLPRLTGVSLSGSGNITGAGKFENESDCDFSLSGSGNIKVSFNKFKKVATNISGSGNIQLTGYAESVNARISGSGTADCTEVTCEDVSASISGSGNVKVTANKSIVARIAGSGNIYYKGTATDIQKQVAGSGRVIKY